MALLLVAPPQLEVATWMQGGLDNEYVGVDGKWKYSRRKFTFDRLGCEVRKGIHCPIPPAYIVTTFSNVILWLCRGHVSTSVVESAGLMKR